MTLHDLDEIKDYYKKESKNRAQTIKDRFY